jgi:hypothetical protein
VQNKKQSLSPLFSGSFKNKGFSERGKKEQITVSCSFLEYVVFYLVKITLAVTLALYF